MDATISFSPPDFIPGVTYTLTVSGIDILEQTDTEVVEFVVPGNLDVCNYFCMVIW